MLRAAWESRSTALMQLEARKIRRILSSLNGTRRPPPAEQRPSLPKVENSPGAACIRSAHSYAIIGVSRPNQAPTKLSLPPTAEASKQASHPHANGSPTALTSFHCMQDVSHSLAASPERKASLSPLMAMTPPECREMLEAVEEAMLQTAACTDYPGLHSLVHGQIWYLPEHILACSQYKKPPVH